MLESLAFMSCNFYRPVSRRLHKHPLKLAACIAAARLPCPSNKKPRHAEAQPFTVVSAVAVDQRKTKRTGSLEIRHP